MDKLSPVRPGNIRPGDLILVSASATGSPSATVTSSPEGTIYATVTGKRYSARDGKFIVTTDSGRVVVGRTETVSRVNVK